MRASEGGERKVYFVAGEASGDRLAADLLRELKKDPKLRAYGVGGPMLKAAGQEQSLDLARHAVVGLTDVLKNLPKFLKFFREVKHEIAEINPDAVILVDYPGFNLRLAQALHREPNGPALIYYVSPQVWAWKASRVKKIKACVDKMIVILPFEKEFYKKWDYEVEYAWHPLLDSLAPNPSPEERGTERLIALLPGSRKQEISVMLPEMLNVVIKFPDYKFIVAGAPSVDESFYKQFTTAKNVSIAFSQTYSLLEKASAALVTSGTATLETALYGVPEVVCYKGSGISFQIAKWLIKVKYISLVNLIMDKEVVKELIQEEMNAANIEKELNELLGNKQRIAEMKKEYVALREKLGNSGASQRAAKSIYNFIK